jgi:hypothetical protein
MVLVLAVEDERGRKHCMNLSRSPGNSLNVHRG